ncbi:extracellular catalytic domain type 1 short-chain-length polyhydroxyalkanoate depolymerase, partial [Aliiglaciecola lipolytica]|uniref:extracellular catalytic domain type 1 short-chain-length polyhydroxyalkanoate depolymerase n=1 Tax=Aliiglaciecola lipolytica TaxID=477689 RepID=UPI00058DF832
QGRALLIVLHGCTQSIDAYLNAQLEVAAETYGMVVAVPDAMNKAGFSCWSYWQGTKSRTAGDYKNLINLAIALRSDSAYNIDDDQVYISGLSSGASFANTTACIAPDVFAGMGISAGPSIGTSSSGALGSCETANVASRCQSYAGSFASHFDTQIASIAHGDADTTVDSCYNQQNAQGMAGVYNVSQIPGSQQINLAGRTADETLWQDNRVSMLWLNGVDHSWSGGQGASGSYISGAGINYAMYLGQFFADNNQRVSRNEAPVVNVLNTQENNSTIVITGSVSDIDGQVVQVDFELEDSVGNTYSLSTQTLTNNNFTVTSASLPDELYTVSAVATDDQGTESETATSTVRVGPPPPATAPNLSEVIATVNSQCATVSGKVVDVNQNLTSVVVAFANGNQTAQVQGNLFSAQACNLAGGQQSATITASDDTNLQSSESVTFTIDAGQTATLDQHINAGRLDYTNYANCYLEYSSNAFKLNEVATTAQQCQWQDDDASCTGPVQACSSSGGGDGGDGGDGGSQTCEQFTTYNYYHKTAGRAYSSGNPYSPNYFAQGSDDAMAGSTWGNTTLHSSDAQTWSVGSCP